MKRYVTDTHALFWYLTASPKLSRAGLSAFRQAERGKAKIVVPVIVLAELYFLNEKLGQPVKFEQEHERMKVAGIFEIVPIDEAAVLLLPKLSAIPEMHDRLIAAVAYQLQVPLLSQDQRIKQSGLINVKW